MRILIKSEWNRDFNARKLGLDKGEKFRREGTKDIKPRLADRDAHARTVRSTSSSREEEDVCDGPIERDRYESVSAYKTRTTRWLDRVCS